jgi:hypothetical protein
MLNTSIHKMVMRVCRRGNATSLPCTSLRVFQSRSSRSTHKGFTPWWSLTLAECAFLDDLEPKLKARCRTGTAMVRLVSETLRLLLVAGFARVHDGAGTLWRWASDGFTSPPFVKSITVA